jgi:pimeloyl-ACP methyl ester carboxylesterase
MADKTALLLLPGLLCDRRLWQPQIEALADRFEPLVADLTRDDSFPTMARRALAEAPPRFALAGLSMGGYVAQEIMRQAPERVERLALLDTSARADTPEQSQRRRDLIALSERGQFHGVTPRLLPLLIHRDRLADAALVETVTAMAQAVGPEAFRRQQKAILARPDGRGDLPRVAVPTLVLCGREDALTPLPLAEEMTDAILGARLIVIEACGHLTTLERPDQVNRAVRDWLTWGNI